MIKIVRALLFKWPGVEWEIEDLRISPIVFRKWSGSSPAPSQKDIDQAVAEYEASLLQEQAVKEKMDLDHNQAIEKLAIAAGLSEDEKEAFREIKSEANVAAPAKLSPDEILNSTIKTKEKKDEI